MSNHVGVEILMYHVSNLVYSLILQNQPRILERLSLLRQIGIRAKKIKFSSSSPETHHLLLPSINDFSNVLIFISIITFFNFLLIVLNFISQKKYHYPNLLHLLRLLAFSSLFLFFRLWKKSEGKKFMDEKKEKRRYQKANKKTKKRNNNN